MLRNTVVKQQFFCFSALSISLLFCLRKLRNMLINTFSWWAFSLVLAFLREVPTSGDIKTFWTSLTPYEWRVWKSELFSPTFSSSTAPTMSQQHFDRGRTSTWMTCIFWIWSCFRIAKLEATTTRVSHLKILFELCARCRFFLRTMFRGKNLSWQRHHQSSWALRFLILESKMSSQNIFFQKNSHFKGLFKFYIGIFQFSTCRAVIEERILRVKFSHQMFLIRKKIVRLWARYKVQ